MGLGPTNLIHPPAEPKKTPKAPQSPRPRLSPVAQPRRLVAVQLWVGFSCPPAVIVLIRSTYSDEGFTRKKKKGKREGRRR